MISEIFDPMDDITDIHNADIGADQLIDVVDDDSGVRGHVCLFLCGIGKIGLTRSGYPDLVFMDALYTDPAGLYIAIFA